MKKHITLFLSITSIIAFAQVGVNTTNPQAKFHVDGKKDNPTSTAPSVSQQTDDIVITDNGFVGIGTTNPTTRFEINNGTTNGAIKIVDGNQAAGKILVSDAEGRGSWQLPNSIKKVQTGIFNKTSSGAGIALESDNTGGFKYSNIQITLTKGVWMVNMGLTFRSTISYQHGDWVHMRISTSNTVVQNNGFDNLGTAQNNTSYAGLIHGSAKYRTVNSNNEVYYVGGSNNFISGSNIIQVNVDTLTLYLMIENKSDENYTYNGTNFVGKKWLFNTSNWENYFYANPL